MSWIEVVFPLSEDINFTGLFRPDVWRIGDDGYSSPYLIGSGKLVDEHGNMYVPGTTSPTHIRFSLDHCLYKGYPSDTMVGVVREMHDPTKIDKVEVRSYHRVLTPAKDFFKLSDKIMDWTDACDCGAAHTKFPSLHSRWCKWNG